MAILSNINGKFAVEDNGAIKFNNLTGTNNQVLIANTGASPTWVDVSTIIGGPYLPLTGGSLAGAGNLVVGGNLTVNGSGGSVFNSTAASNHIIAAYRATNGNNVATFRTTDSGYIFRIHAQNAGTIYVQNDDGSNYLKIADSGSNEVSGNTTFIGTVTTTGLTVQAGTYHKVITSFPSTYKTNLQIGQQLNISNNAITDTVTFANTGTEAVSEFIFTIAGNEKLKIDGSGTTKITTDGTEQLILHRSDSSIFENNTIGTIKVTADDPTANVVGGQIQFTGGGTWSSNNYPTNIIFSNDNAGTLTERMRIDSAGTIIGTGTYTASGSIKIFEAKRNGGAVKSDWDYHDSSPIRMSIGTSTSHNFAIKTADTPRLTITSGGNVGIGTDSPQNFTNQRSLTVSGTSIGRVDVQVTAGGGGGIYGSSSQMKMFSNYGMNLALESGSGGGVTTFATNATERMKIDQFGQIFSFGQMRLELAATETNPIVGTNCSFMFQNTSNTDGNFAVVDFRNSTGFVTGRIGAQFQDAGDRNTDLFFMTRENAGSLTERMRITSTGQLRLQGSSSSLAKSTTQTQFAFIPGNTYATLMPENPSGMSSASAGYHIVYGANNSSPYQAFIDVITYQCGSSTNVTVISSTTLNNSPGSRSYSKNSNAVLLNISGAADYNCNIKTTFINFPH